MTVLLRVILVAGVASLAIPLAVPPAVALAAAGRGDAAGAPGAAAGAARHPLSPARRAAVDAAGLLEAFRPPPGALPARAPMARPGSGGPALAVAPERPATPDLATRTEWWLAPGNPAQVLGWIARHHTAGLTLAGTGEVTRAHAVTVRFAEFAAPPVPGVLIQRGLIVSVARAPARFTAIRVDAQVLWLPPRPAGERIPGTAASVTVVPVGPDPFGPGTVPTGPAIVVTDRARVRMIAALVNALPLLPPGVLSCPVDGGRALRLTFGAGWFQPPLAVVTAHEGGCGAVSVVKGGRSWPALWHGRELAARVLAMARER